VVFPGEPGAHGETMSKESKPNITRRNVLAGIGASGAGLALGAHGVAAGTKKHNDNYDVPVAIDWQEAVYKGGEWMQVEAFPDDDNDRHQDHNIDFCDGGMMNSSLIDVDDPLSSDLRTHDDYTSSGDPLINYHGVKPGYGGEVTLSYHLCGEPGKVKLKAKDVHVDKKLAHLARARVWYDEFDGAEVTDPGTGNPVMVPPVSGVVPDDISSDLIDEIIVTVPDDRFENPGGQDVPSNFTCENYADILDLDITTGPESEIINPDEGIPITVGRTYEGCTDITVDDHTASTGTITLSSDGAVLVVSIKGGPNGEQVYVFDEPVVLDEATFTTPGDYGISNIDVCCPETINGGPGNGNGNGNGRGDNVYQPYEPVIAQGSLKKVLHKLKKGVHVSGDPYVAGPFDREGIHYYAYPRENTSSMETPPAEKYDPGWITDDNVDECVDEKKVKKLKHLDDGVKLCIDGTGYVARNEDNPLPDLCIEVKKVITGKKGKPVGFEWESNLPICRIEIAAGDRTDLTVFDRAREGTVMAPRYDDHDDNGRRHPITGVRFGVCDDHDEDDYCIDNSNTGYIGFEWWLPKHAGLKGKKTFQTNFDFKAKPCHDDNHDST